MPHTSWVHIFVARANGGGGMGARMNAVSRVLIAGDALEPLSLSTRAQLDTIIVRRIAGNSTIRFNPDAIDILGHCHHVCNTAQDKLRYTETMTKLTTSHLELIPTSLELIQAELESHSQLASAIGARVPDGWPPGEYDRPAIEYFKARLSENPKNAGWYGWYAILPGEGSGPDILVGAGGFFGPPTTDQVVEIGYSIVPSFEGRGYATELVTTLVEHAFSTGKVRRIIAHTAARNAGSIKVLEKAGFRLVGPDKGDGTLEYECGFQAG
jgi:[ribosomal protein S5]-alanine N-acetyltransferase